MAHWNLPARTRMRVNGLRKLLVLPGHVSSTWLERPRAFKRQTACMPCSPAVRRYSWGSCLAAHGLSHPAVAAYVGVSVPLGGMAWVLQTKKHFGEVCRAIHVPRLLLLGDQVRLEVMHGWVRACCC